MTLAQAWARLLFHSKWMRWNGIERDKKQDCQDEIGSENLVLNSVHEQQMRTGDIASNGHEQYFSFTLIHYRSYFLNEITLFNLIQ